MWKKIQGYVRPSFAPDIDSFWIFCALSTQPNSIICDEPVSALDIAVPAQILHLLHSLQTEFGLTFLFISHDLGVVQRMCDRIAVMYMGKLLNMLTKIAYLPIRNIFTWFSVRRSHGWKKRLKKRIVFWSQEIHQTLHLGRLGDDSRTGAHWSKTDAYKKSRALELWNQAIRLTATYRLKGTMK